MSTFPSSVDLKSFFDNAGGAPASDRPRDSMPTGESGGDVMDIIKSAAERNGVPPELAFKISGAESSFKPGVKNQTGSSAGGLFQVIDSTWKSMGGSPNGKYDPEENADVGTRLISKNMDALKRDLKRNPTYGEVYAAHVFGSGVSKMLASADRNQPIEQGLSLFENQGRVQTIMEQNPNLRGKTVGQVLADISRKVGNGVAQGPAPDKSADSGKYYEPRQAGKYVDITERKGATAMDVAKEFFASATEGVGSIGQFAGEGAAAVANAVTGTEDYQGKNILKPVSEGIRNTMTEGGKQARESSNIEGSVLDLFKGDAKLPDNVDGWLMMGANGFGSLLTSVLPIAGPAGRVASLTKAARAAELAGDVAKAAELTKAAEAAARTSRVIGAGSGAAMTGGAAADDVRDSSSKAVASMTHEQLLAAVPLYSEVFAQTGDERQARNAVVNTAARWAAGLSSVAGAAGGAFNAKVIEDFLAKKGMSTMLGDSMGSRAGRAAVGGAAGTFAEGGQETSEKVGQNIGENIGLARDPGADAFRNTAGDFVGGALVGGPIGAGGGFVSKPSQPVVPPHLQPVVEQAQKPGSVLSRAAVAGNQGVLAQAAATPATPVEQPAIPAQAAAEQPTIAAQRAPAADATVERVRAIEDGMRANDWLDTLRDDGVDTRELLQDLAQARDTRVPQAARNAALERVETAISFATQNAQPRARMDSIQNNPAFDAPPPARAVETPQVPNLDAIGAALSDPALRAKISDTDRDELLYQNNLARNPNAPQTVRVGAARLAMEIVGRYQAGNAQGSAAQTAPALLSPVAQQNVAEQTPAELDFLQAVPEPKVSTPAGEGPALLRKRSAVVKQLVDNGFETVARDGKDFYLTNTKTGQKFKLDGPADAQLARKAISDRVNAIADTAAASPRNSLSQPTKAQIEAGNYKKSDVIELNGMKIKIENPKDSIRSGVSPDGEVWETKMAHHYGEFQGTVGADGDKLDVFIGPRPDSNKVYVIDQVNEDGSFDEHKVMMGFTSEDAARQGYLANYSEGWTGLGAITEMSPDEFKTWAKSRAAKKPLAKLTEKAAPVSAAPAAAPADIALEAEDKETGPIGQFATYEEARSYISKQRQANGNVSGLPLRLNDGSFTIASKNSPQYAEAKQQQDERDGKQVEPEKQGEFFYVKDGEKNKKLKRVKKGELPKKTSARRPGEPRPISQDEATLIEQIASVLGKNVVFYEAQDGRLSDGFFDPSQPNTLFVATETTVNPLAVFGHEFFHGLRESNPEAWNAIAAVVRERVTDPKGFREDYYGEETANQQGDAALSEQKGGELEELVSDLGGNLMMDAGFWREVFAKIAEDNGDQAKGIVARLAASLEQFIARVMSAIKQNGFAAESFISDAGAVRSAYKDGLAEYIKAAGISKMAMGAEITKASQQVKKSTDKASKPTDGLTVEGYHFSQQPRQTLSTGMYGTGLKGSAREEIMNADDKRLKERLSFYVNKGTGIRPEAGVGSIAHKATLSNIYDADADALRLRSGNARDFESKVLDAGYSGYLQRMEGTQPGQVILLGKQTVKPEVLGARNSIDNAKAVPAAVEREADLADQIASDKSLPAGALSLDRWSEVLMAKPEVHAKLQDAGVFDGKGTLYKGELATRVREMEGQIRKSADRARKEYADVEAKYKGTDQWMKAPNGADTKLTERQWVQVRTPSFKKWFGDWEKFAAMQGGVWNDSKNEVSKVVDKNGEPMVVYHGSDKGGFIAFEQPGFSGRGDLGIWTTDSYSMARSYVRRGRDRTVDLSQGPSTRADLEELGFTFFEQGDGSLEVDTPEGYTEKYATEEEAVKALLQVYADGLDLAGTQPGVYSLFMNLRDVAEEDFQGALWNGDVEDKVEVVDENGDNVFNKNDDKFFDQDEAEALVQANPGYEITPAYGVGMTTDDVVREAIRGKQDGAIIRRVIDDGGGPGYYLDPADIFVALDSTDVKSADYNNGEFSDSTADLRQSKDRKLKRENEFEMSTRIPSAKPGKDVVLENPTDSLLISDFNSGEDQERWIDSVAALVTTYPNYREAGGATTSAKKLERLIRQMQDNLVWLHNKVPASTRMRSKLWYDGANAIANRMSKKYDISEAQASGVLAVLSPQKDWFMNVSLAERVAQIMAERQSFKWSAQMDKTADRIYGAAKYQEDVDAIRGKTLADLKDDDYLSAMWLRTYDQAHNSSAFMVVSPEGDPIAEARVKSGKPANVAWGGNGTIAKAISIFRDGSLENISEQLGRKHKVRNFYNNIFVPNSKNGHVTIDTHAVAAALLRPLSGNSIEVMHNFGGAKNALKGLEGTYALYEEAYRRAANQLKLLPRELQSITWEAIRGMYRPTFKAQSKNVAEVDKIWNQFKKGRLSYEGARDWSLESAGRIDEPSWLGRDPGAYVEDESSAEPGDVPGDGVSGRGSEESFVRADVDDSGAAEASIRQSRDRDGRDESGSIAPLPGAPIIEGATGPDAQLVQVAQKFARENGIDLRRQKAYVEVDPELAARIAAAYEAMPHDPQDPRVAEAYDNLIRQTRAQYDALVDAGYEFTFFDAATDPYAGNPWNAMRDLRQNKRMAVYGTYDGFGTEGVTQSAVDDNPMLADTGLDWEDQNGKLHPVLANDLFRAVHDAFGHGLEGAGFRDRGEENAWQAHARLFTGSALGAITSETRGQNSWLNYGPYGEKNRTAKVEDTIFAEQKTGLMPEWTWREGRDDDGGPDGGRKPTKRTEELSVLKSVDRPQFYSQLQRSIEAVPQRLASMTAPAWKQWLTANAPKLGIKAEEIEWSGIKDYLDLQGKNKLSKDNLSAYLADSGVKISEVQLGANPIQNRTGEVVGPDSEGNYYVSWSDGSRYGPFFDEEEALDQLDAEPEEDEAGATKYGKYTLPGGENYRELLITLPVTERDVARYEKDIVVREDDTGYRKFEAKYKASNGRELFGYGNTPEEAKQGVLKQMKLYAVAEQEPYESSHWNEANVLAHIRVNDRTDADGKKVLFVEEVQSDWGQDGKKKGFDLPVGQLAPGQTVKEETGSNGRVSWVVRNSQGESIGFGDTRDEAIADTPRKNIPAAPFVTKTEGWLNLALKRIAMMAVEGGYDKVAFVNGEQSAARYDLSKQVDRILWLPDTDGLGGELKAYDARRQEVVSRSNVKNSELPDLVGKEVAERILSKEPDSTGFVDLENQDLKVGGEGMKTFYNKLVPQAMNKLLPKLGGDKVGDISFGNLNGRFTIIDGKSGQQVGRYKTREQADSFMQQAKSAQSRGLVMWFDANNLQHALDSSKVSQPGFDVTDKMRETVGQGVPLFSRDRPYFEDLSKLKVTTNYQLGDLLKSSKKLSWWDRTIGTQYNLAQKHPQFKRVFDAVQEFINDVSAYATRAADMAPNILPKLETLRDITKSPLAAADVKALRDPIFGGTLKYARDEQGNIYEEDDVGKAGVVFKDEELRDMFKLTDEQISLYREFRSAVDQSLTDLAISDMLRYLGEDGEAVKEEVMAAGNVDFAVAIITRHLNELGIATRERAATMANTIEAIETKAEQANSLMDRGYAPLSRFGQYTVYVVGPNGEQEYFSMFESQADANVMARKMEEQYPEATVTTGTMSQESYKLFSGVTPETLALFGESLGLEESGVDPKSEAYQQMLKVAKTNRSAMKRLIQRKGIDGYSEDAGRVLAGFVYSNARQVATNLHAGEISRSVQQVTDGDVKDAAIRLMEYIQKPQEEAQALRGLMFTQFIGGSIASALVNMTQPFTMTLPYLSQFAGVTGAGKLMTDAVKLASRGIRNDDELRLALKRAEDEGVVSPQEVHQLMAQAQGRGSLQSGDGTKMGDAAAKMNNTMAKLNLGWGKVFSAAEQFNRRVTFIAAYKMARDQGMENPFQFAENAIAETQGVYNKGNKPAWARGAVGGTLFTFKQYSIGYVEFLRRMWGNGPEGKKAVGLALGVLFLMSGVGGMPGADDMDDVIDGFAQRVLGKSFDSKQAKKEFFASILGQAGAEFVMSGISGLPGMPIDVAGRMGLGNLVPGTGLFTKKRDYAQDYKEIVGPAGTLFTNAGLALASVAEGDIRKAGVALAPVAAQNWIKAVDMANMGYYRDQKGRKVVDTDGYDTFVKFLGFQPRAVAQVQDATSTQQGLIAQNKLRETEIADKWAAGRIEKDPAKVEQAKQMLADWNEKNPQSKISIDAAQINKRVIEANKTKAQRIAATAPKEIRGSVKKELESALRD